jgi:DNA-binding transcriptional ArsR family regulator
LARQSLQSFKADLFKAMGHPTRIRILELLRPGEMTVSELQASLDIESSSVSQQLAVLRSKHIVDARREGTSVFYRVHDRKIVDLLDLAREIFANHLLDLQNIASEDEAIGEADSIIPKSSEPSNLS